MRREFQFKSTSDHVICKSCVLHQGRTGLMMDRRDRDHVNLWHSELQVVQLDHQEAMARQDARVEDARAQTARVSEQLADARGVLMAELNQRPVESVATWVGNDLIMEANKQRDAAYRNRDAAFAVIWRIDDVHFTDDQDSDKCACGNFTGRCKVWRSLEPIRPALYRWEEAQTQRMNDGLEHGLPGDHPKSVEWFERNSSIDWKGPRRVA